MIASWKGDPPAVQGLHFPACHHANLSTLGPSPDLPSITYAHLKGNVKSELSRNNFSDDPLRQNQPSNGNHNLMIDGPSYKR
ncbi:Uncharacterized protein HZ326_19528 [Fusarium oxysporum f. sp. albedinis]|nr:Uncharacterized protein HZ326_19528 [Fusarium oxysporum f. sp. albedinis]